MAEVVNKEPFTSPSGNKFVQRDVGAILGWDRAPKRLWPTLTRKDDSEAWGLSVVCGQDILESGGRWSGIATRRNERGLWIKVCVYLCIFKSPP